MSKPMIATMSLQGKRVLVTRTREQASALSQQLRAAGAIPIEFPTIRIEPPRDWAQLDMALQQLYMNDEHSYDWLVFTSANGVAICCERLQELGHDLQAMRPVRIAAIGPATAAMLVHYGLKADLVPNDYIAESVAAAIIEDARRRGVSLADMRILLARAAEARKVLVSQLQEAGAHVDEVAAYYTHSVRHDDVQGHTVLDMLHQGQIDVLTFTSSSTVRNFVAWLKDCEQYEHAQAATPEQFIAVVTTQPTIRIACIGPITAQTARELGLPVHIEAKEFSIDGLMRAIVAYYSSIKE